MSSAWIVFHVVVGSASCHVFDADADDGLFIFCFMIIGSSLHQTASRLTIDETEDQHNDQKEENPVLDEHFVCLAQETTTDCRNTKL